MVQEPKITRPSLTGAASLNFDYVQGTRLKWTGGGESGLYDLSFVIHYRERNSQVGGAFENKSFVWNVLNNYEDKEYDLIGLEFFGTMASNLEANPNIERRFRFLDMIVSAGGEEIQEYVRIGQANSGLTSSQDIPVFTNMSEGRGIFTSRQQSINPQIPITSTTLDSLANGEFTNMLNFTN